MCANNFDDYLNATICDYKEEQMFKLDQAIHDMNDDLYRLHDQHTGEIRDLNERINRIESNIRWLMVYSGLVTIILFILIVVALFY